MRAHTGTHFFYPIKLCNRPGIPPQNTKEKDNFLNLGQGTGI